MRDKRFSSERVILDDKDFMNCQLHKCELVYHGGPVTFLETAIVRCRWSFGGAAHCTLNLVQCLA